ncbi:MAG: hypothetical protein FWH05_08185 [Oscillospiraceae bacterium]|nr:hypothetical protein [Oscillospiraceae bacterium]
MNNSFKKNVQLLLLALPFLLLFFVFTVLPILGALPLSFGSVDSLGFVLPVGLENWSRLMNDTVFWQGFGTTMLFSIVFAPLLFAFNIIMAFLVARFARGRAFLLFCLPFFAAMPVSFGYLFSDEIFGYFNSLSIHQGGVELLNFSSEFTTLLLVELWLSFGMSFILLFFAFRKIPREYADAVRMEANVNFFHELWEFALPSISKKLLPIGFISLSTAVAMGGGFSLYADSLSAVGYANRLVSQGESGFAAAALVLIYAAVALLFFALKLAAKYLPKLFKWLAVRRLAKRSEGDVHIPPAIICGIKKLFSFCVVKVKQLLNHIKKERLSEKNEED